MGDDAGLSNNPNQKPNLDTALRCDKVIVASHCKWLIKRRARWQAKSSLFLVHHQLEVDNFLRPQFAGLA